MRKRSATVGVHRGALWIPTECARCPGGQHPNPYTRDWVVHLNPGLNPAVRVTAPGHIDLADKEWIARAVRDAPPDTYRTTSLAYVLSELDRCIHGRHEGDDCTACDGTSVGNLKLPVGEVIGTGLYGTPIVMPAATRRHLPAAWYRP